MTGAAFPKVFAFDVFGTVVDWRTNIIAECAKFLTAMGRTDIDAIAFADPFGC